jgi:hypothetical protein
MHRGVGMPVASRSLCLVFVRFAEQLAVALLILFIAYALQVRYRPFQTPSDHPNIVQDHAVKAMSHGPHAVVAAAIRSVRSRTCCMFARAPVVA